MDVRFSTDPRGFLGMTVEELRSSYLIDGLFRSDDIPMVYSDIDRSITGTAVPVAQELALKATTKEMAAEYFAERREIGVINIGNPGVVRVDGKSYPLGNQDGLYIGRGSKEIIFASAEKNSPAKFYFVSYPAHAPFPTTKIVQADAERTALGSLADANKRTIFKYIHPRGARSCQLVMGLTKLDEGSVWNTMPPHTHQRRSEVYMYFDLPPSSLVIHLVGQPERTRHIIIRNEQAVLSPSWSLHAGVGTKRYSFIWAMGGENQVFDDMDGIAMNDLG